MNNQHRRRRRSTDNLNLSSNLPHDLILQILLRLPVRSLLRFKSVCKSWRSLISDPQFDKSHFDLAAAPTYRYIGHVNDSSEIESLDVNASFHDESSVVKHKIPVASPPDPDPDFMGSCRGFILVTYDCGNTFVWNPATGVQRRVAADDIGGEASYKMLTGFGYDMSTDDYLIVLIQMIRDDSRNYIEFFPLRTNSWSRVEVANAKYVCPGADLRVGSFLNQALHWLVKSFNTKLHVIIAFDLVERSLSEIPLSHNLARKLKHEHYHLRVMGECLSLCYPGDRTSKAEIWTMKDYKVQSSWTRLFVFSTSNIPCNVFVPICFTKHGGIFGSNGSRRLLM